MVMPDARGPPRGRPIGRTEYGREIILVFLGLALGSVPGRSARVGHDHA